MAASADTLISVDHPIRPKPGFSGADRIFRGSARGIAVAVSIIFGSIGVFLGLQAIPTIRRYGFGFITRAQWNPETNKLGISSTLLGTFEVALIALAVAFPLALATAIFISEYAP